ncbi:peptidase domain-containing ABC transporter [Flavobacterium psychrophilum]|uniref:peptidase domain-containing ABC transporter n=1 Tax=Flavobacterium psychrophilum TaxID=96345 RepID=UPI000B7C0F1F|nr:peptidase domain-containing ABC transporter [Flavobacterium psychrophilum]SNA68991.1 putative ABC-type multidrug transport system, ATPase and permease components [Flavobacterium psychrophilum]SNB01125.1 putative ABC-type multidrug transport system, ATPase and permease components [Flavobacterium psychrophilum]
MKFIPQYNIMDCGPACLAMIANKYGKKYTLKYLREQSFLTREGVSLLGISEAAQNIGFETITTKINLEQLLDLPRPCILHWKQKHFVVLEKIKGSKKNKKNIKSFFKKDLMFKIADPSYGFLYFKEVDFLSNWISDDNKGIALFLNPTEDFHKSSPPIENKISIKYLTDLLNKHKKQFLWMFICLFLGNLINVAFPFLTQNLIDKGIANKNLSLVQLILFSQISLFLGSMTVEIIRNWIVLKVGTKISITIISDFLKKLLQLPIKFFDTKIIGDFTQRIQDNERIESFLTSQSLVTIFSIISFCIFFVILGYYNYTILFIYLFLTIIAIFWSVCFLKKRSILDFYKFQLKSENQSAIYEIINGVTEMKLNQFQDFKNKEWQKIQEKLFKINTRVLKLYQFQIGGFEIINQIKNIIVTYIAATCVIKGKMTLGELMAISFILGQMISPLNSITTFFYTFQDAKLSLERLSEVQNHEDEENEKLIPLSKINSTNQYGIRFQNLSFQYEGPKSPYVLKDINFTIPDGKISAIVGASGSGKTTLMKLLLKFYEPTQGELLFNSENINDLSPKSLRENCGVVMQDGYIFSDTIERNIATGDENINKEKLQNAVKIANIEEFVKSLPLGYNTKIGASGNGISGGQKQRILIARAVYKNPHYIFFDEATSALDAENEKIIHDNLQQFFKGKTVLIIAHRLSTVKNADQIIVLKNGEIAETGNHQQLVQNKGDYFNLVKNQLELGD